MHDAGRWRWLRTGRDGMARITLRDASGQPAADYEVDAATARPRLAREYVYAAGALAVERRYAPDGTASEWYHHRDHLGSLRIVTDEAGRKAEAHDWYPYGQEMASWTATGATTRKLFTGHERDAETGLDYMLARYYASPSGAFLTVDPLDASAKAEDPLSWNRYAYVLGNPLNRVDPTGMYGDDVHFSLTFMLGVAAGLPSGVARTIANYDAQMDRGVTHPWLIVIPFGPDLIGSIHFPNQSDVATATLRAANAKNPQMLGNALHVIQDAVGHEGYSRWTFGHWYVGARPDEKVNPNTFVPMANTTYDLISSYAQRQGFAPVASFKSLSAFIRFAAGQDDWIRKRLFEKKAADLDAARRAPAMIAN